MSLFGEVIKHLGGAAELDGLVVADPALEPTSGGTVVIVQDISTEQGEKVRLDIKGGEQADAIDVRSQIAQVLLAVERDSSNDLPNFVYSKGAYTSAGRAS